VGGDDKQMTCMCFIDIETNEIKFKMLGEFVTMQPLAIHPETQEVRYLLVQKKDEIAVIDCHDFTT
jgi:hypothetical protein